MVGHEAERSPAEWFEVLACSADAVAETAEMSARVHDSAAGYLPGAAEHAQRERRFAAAERAAAAAYRNHGMPSDDVRRVIRESGRGPADLHDAPLADGQ